MKKRDWGEKREERFKEEGLEKLPPKRPFYQQRGSCTCGLGTDLHTIRGRRWRGSRSVYFGVHRISVISV